MLVLLTVRNWEVWQDGHLWLHMYTKFCKNEASLSWKALAFQESMHHLHVRGARRVTWSYFIMRTHNSRVACKPVTGTLLLGVCELIYIFVFKRINYNTSAKNSRCHHIKFSRPGNPAPLWGTQHIFISWANMLCICEMVTDKLFSTCDYGISWAVNLTTQDSQTY